MKSLLLLLLAAVTALFILSMVTPPGQFDLSRLLKTAEQWRERISTPEKTATGTVPTFPPELMILESLDGRSIRARVLAVNGGTARILREDGIEFDLVLNQLTGPSRARIEIPAPPVERGTAPAETLPLPGLTPEDLRQSLEAKGFFAEEGPDDGEGQRTLVRERAGVNCFVSATSNRDQLVQILASVTNLGGRDTDDAATEALTALADLPFTDGDPKQASTWLRSRMGMNAECLIGGVRFQLFANVPRSRTLRITAPHPTPP